MKAKKSNNQYTLVFPCTPRIWLHTKNVHKHIHVFQGTAQNMNYNMSDMKPEIL